MAACHSIDRAIEAIAPTQANLGTYPSWVPVIYFDDGRTERLAGGYSHDVAMAIAEKVSELLIASGFGVQREGLSRLPREQALMGEGNHGSRRQNYSLAPSD